MDGCSQRLVIMSKKLLDVDNRTTCDLFYVIRNFKDHRKFVGSLFHCNIWGYMHRHTAHLKVTDLEEIPLFLHTKSRIKKEFKPSLNQTHNTINIYVLRKGTQIPDSVNIRYDYHCVQNLLFPNKCIQIYPIKDQSYESCRAEYGDHTYRLIMGDIASLPWEFYGHFELKNFVSKNVFMSKEENKWLNDMYVNNTYLIDLTLLLRKELRKKYHSLVLCKTIYYINSEMNLLSSHDGDDMPVYGYDHNLVIFVKKHHERQIFRVKVDKIFRNKFFPFFIDYIANFI